MVWKCGVRLWKNDRTKFYFRTWLPMTRGSDGEHWSLTFCHLHQKCLLHCQDGFVSGLNSFQDELFIRIHMFTATMFGSTTASPTGNLIFRNKGSGVLSVPISINNYFSLIPSFHPYSFNCGILVCFIIINYLITACPIKIANVIIIVEQIVEPMWKHTR